ncbi:anti-sigma factor [Terrimonas sp.]|uniref:FecR family protein n=1 Tax=Terrimonas sp. TaxID=1914338 RepID=UPI000D506945|nr:FecR family protein [Terrimonas sp.]PVD52868.1 anti-sigma factor [Terrimonas sp.]
MFNTERDKRLAELEEKWLKGIISDAEKKEYADWYNDINETIPLDISPVFASDADELKRRIFNRIKIKGGIGNQIWKKKTLKLSVAASILAIATITGLHLFSRKTSDQVTAVVQEQMTNDAAPGIHGAVLILADGSRVLLDSSKSENIANQGNTKVLRTREGLTYKKGAGMSDSRLFNTVVTPRSRQFNLVLPDGSAIWMNAESSVKFPVEFNKSVREIEFIGEGYFEIAPVYDQRKKVPFIVNINRTKIEVLGTHFNIMAYKNEGVIETTLLEGKVKVVNGKKENVLKPGQQAASNSEGIKINSSPDIEKVMAWKKGKFMFEETNIQQVMRQLCRWYDIEVEYAENVMNYDFSGGITMYTNVSDVLKMLELTGTLKFRIENKKVFVSK